jgi:hypothetical protein
LVEVDCALRSLGREIGGFVIYAQHGVSWSRGSVLDCPFFPSPEHCKEVEFPDCTAGELTALRMPWIQ